MKNKLIGGVSVIFAVLLTLTVFNTDVKEVDSKGSSLPSAFEYVNDNVPYFTDREKSNTKAFESYSRLDSLGRCGVAYANVCKELMPTEERGEIGSVKPSGWHTVKYNDIIDGNYLYNRCHLIGYQLAGENANKKNLITGTRFMNVNGMLPFENEVADYIDSHPNNHVLYRVTPDFEDSNLVASGVLMEAYSVEDKGAGVEFCVYCPNIQPGITIDYATGSSEVDKSYTGLTTKEVTTSGKSSVKSSVTVNGSSAGKSASTDTSDLSQYAFILNTSTKKAHLPSCKSVKSMSSKNMKGSNESKEELINEGYTACKNCNPF